MDIVIPYWRYSSPAQEDGDSLARQEALIGDWCEQHGATIDNSRNYVDKARRAFDGTHRKKGDMGRFLADVEAGRIPKGTILAVENLDRFSRESPWDATYYFLGLIHRDIKILALFPEETLYYNGAPSHLLDQAHGELKRAHSESKSKQERGIRNWARKKREAREQGKIYTRHLPAWVKEVGGKLEEIPEKADVVRRIFDMCIEGRGVRLIVKQLTVEGVRPIGKAKVWREPYIHQILTHRAVLGEFQPTKGKKSDGEVLPTYYPVLLSEDRWLRAQAALGRRKQARGRKGERVASLFTGITWDARTRSKMRIGKSGTGARGSPRWIPVLEPADGQEGRTKSITFPYLRAFEPAVLDLLKEINPAELLGQEPARETAALTTKRIAAQQKLQELVGEAKARDKVGRTLVQLIEDQEAEVDDLLQREAEARVRESNPKSAAWAEAKTLLQMAQDEKLRLRLRSLLSEMLESIWVLIVPRLTHRLAAVQVNFAGGTTRHFLIHYRSGGNGRKWFFTARSAAWPAGDRPEEPCLDLRKPEDATALERFLSELPLDV